jgi:hypothetical protein
MIDSTYSTTEKCSSPVHYLMLVGGSASTRTSNMSARSIKLRLKACRDLNIKDVKLF